MDKRLKYFFICFVLSLLICVLFLYQKKNLSSNTPPTILGSHVLPTPTILPTGNLNSLCHAQFLDQNDPQAVLPDPTCTPGALNQDVTQDNIRETICRSGYTATIRPVVSYTNKLKKEQIQEYGFNDTSMKDYEEDHFISLELGGSPDSPLNLWPEPHGSPNEKDKVENYLHQQICNGSITLQEAQKEISTDWYTVYKNILQ